MASNNLFLTRSGPPAARPAQAARINNVVNAIEQFNGTKWWADVNLCCLQLQVVRNREIKLSRTSHRSNLYHEYTVCGG